MLTVDQLVKQGRMTQRRMMALQSSPCHPGGCPPVSTLTEGYTQ